MCVTLALYIQNYPTSYFAIIIMYTPISQACYMPLNNNSTAQICFPGKIFVLFENYLIVENNKYFIPMQILELISTRQRIKLQNYKKEIIPSKNFP